MTAAIPLTLEIALGEGLSYDIETGTSWEDFSGQVVSAKVDRGYDSRSLKRSPATATIVLNDPDGELNPLNGESPYVGQLRTNTPIRLTATDADANEPTIFCGLVDRVIPAWTSTLNHSTVTIECVDIVSALGEMEFGTSPYYLQIQEHFSHAAATDSHYWPLNERYSDTAEDIYGGLTAELEASSNAPRLVSTGSGEFQPYVGHTGQQTVSFGGMQVEDFTLTSDTDRLAFFVLVKMPGLPGGTARNFQLLQVSDGSNFVTFYAMQTGEIRAQHNTGSLTTINRYIPNDNQPHIVYIGMHGDFNTVSCRVDLGSTFNGAFVSRPFVNSMTDINEISIGSYTGTNVHESPPWSYAGAAIFQIPSYVSISSNTATAAFEGLENQSVSERMEFVQDLLDDDHNVSDGWWLDDYGVRSNVTLLGGAFGFDTIVSDYLELVANSDGGRLGTTAEGQITLIHDGATIEATFSDTDSEPGIGYQDLRLEVGADKLINRVVVKRTFLPETFVVTDGSNGDKTFTIETEIADIDRAKTLGRRFLREPSLNDVNVRQLTVNARASDDATNACLNLDVGSQVRLFMSPLPGQDPISRDLIITGISHDITATANDWLTTYELTNLKEYPMTNVLTDSTTLSDTTPSNASAVQWGTEEVTISNPGVDVTVQAWVSGYIEDPGATAGGYVTINVSLDGGSTWTDSTPVFAYVDTAIDLAVLASNFAHSGTPTGDIVVKASICDFSAGIQYAAGFLQTNVLY
ncbi:hypothetical protein [Actinospongicola halichondriae]|uniref:hypothetical protein n=1 Tax=Actinospongicola halichondriae TaxID=3236844 RepID=UPI003D45D960